MRYAVPALILVDAESEDEAHMKALILGPTLDREEGPGAFFPGVTTAVTDWPRAVEDRENESLAAHAESIEAGSGMQ